MLTGILAGLAAGALWGLVFVAPRMLMMGAIHDAGTEMPSLLIGTISLWIMLLGKPHGLRWLALLPGPALTLAGLLLMMGSAPACAANSS